MPWTGSAPSKVFSRTDGTRTGSTVWQDADAAGVDIVADDHDTHDEDIGDSLNLALLKDGGNTATADLPMGGFTLTGLADAAAQAEPVVVKQMQNQSGVYIATPGGTADAITASTGMTLAAYVAGLRLAIKAGANNTGATTLNVDSLGAKSVVRNDGSATALSANDIISGCIFGVQYNGTNFLLVDDNIPKVSNPVTVAQGGTGQTTAAEAIGELTQAMTEDTTPDRQLDFAAVYDASGDTGSKVALYNVTGQAVLATGTVTSSSTLDLALDAYTQFKTFKLYLVNGVVETDEAVIWARFSDDGGITFEADASDYSHASATESAGDVHATIKSLTATEIVLTGPVNNATDAQFDLELTLYNPAGTSKTRMAFIGTYEDAADDAASVVGGGGANVAGATTDIRILTSGGDFSCTYTLVGII